MRAKWTAEEHGEHTMERIDRILKNPVYRETQRQLDELEQERIYCKHGTDHALDTARIMYIRVLEQSLPFDKELVYAAALLHDLGRCSEYQNKKPHHEAGAVLAEGILLECGFTETETGLIVKAIRGHREGGERPEGFSALLYEADKLSRTCWQCRVADTCKWTDGKKNHTVLD